MNRKGSFPKKTNRTTFFKYWTKLIDTHSRTLKLFKRTARLEQDECVSVCVSVGKASHALVCHALSSHPWFLRCWWRTVPEKRLTQMFFGPPDLMFALWKALMKQSWENKGKVWGAVGAPRMEVRTQQVSVREEGNPPPRPAVQSQVLRGHDDITCTEFLRWEDR